jgi:nicotinamidase/pyrazinamidase
LNVTTYNAVTALVVVDVQNDFADPKGSLYVQGGDDVPAVVNEQIAAAREAGAFIVYSQDWHPSETPHFKAQGGVWPVHCVGGTWGAEFHPDLEVAEDVEPLRKGTGGEDGYSVFTVRDPETGEEAATALERILREHGVERVVIAGLATDYCVKDTVLDARRLGFPATVITAAIRAVNLREGDGARAEQQMRQAGAKLV